MSLAAAIAGGTAAAGAGGDRAAPLIGWDILAALGGQPGGFAFYQTGP